MVDLFIGLFKKLYTIRHYGTQVVVNGYTSAAYADTQMKLDIQPLTPDELMALPEGERTVKRVKTFGPDRLTSADDYTGTPGDRLFYNGLWYECTSSVMWDHTLLSHYRSDFVIIPQNEQEEMPPEPSEPDPGGGGP